MEESKILRGYELLMLKDICKRAIESAKTAADWEFLLIQFRRAERADFLGEFETVKQSFIKTVESDIIKIDNQIAEL